jgi:deoxycytidylate deaminase
MRTKLILNRDIKTMQFVKRLAIDNPGVNNRMKLAAALVIKRDIISVGVNVMRSHPVQKKYGKNDESIFLHAEINAIVNSLNHVDKDDLRKADLYVYRVKKDMHDPKRAHWVDGMSCPCEGCMSAIDAFKIKRVVYSTDTNFEYGEMYF